jgi:hypothetical protein
MTPEDHGQATDDSARRVEIVARALYRHFMDEDYDEFPWDDECEPSSETVEEARTFAEIAVRALAEEYKADDERFRRAVDERATLAEVERLLERAVMLGARTDVLQSNRAALALLRGLLAEPQVNPSETGE